MKRHLLLTVILLLKSIASFSQWSTQLQGGAGSYLSIHFADSNNGFVTGSRFQFSKTSSGGNQWISQNQNLGPEELTSVFMTTSNDVYLVIKAVGTGNLDQLFISRDGGVNFIRNRYGIFRTVYFQNATTGYCVGPSGTMIKTIDAGQLWNQLNTGTIQQITDVYFSDAQIGFIVGDNGMLRKTSNGGSTWQALNPGSTANLSAVYFTSSTAGYCVGANGTALRTQNGGVSWTVMPVGTAVALHDIIFTNSTTGFIVGDLGTILSTSDGGTSWRSEASNTFESLNAMATAPNGRIWAAGDNGTVLVRTPVATQARPSLPAGSYALYPNPVVDQFTIDFPKPIAGLVQVLVKDVTGRTVLPLQHINAKDAFRLSLASWPAGIYVVEVISSQGSWTQKIVKEN